MSSLLDANDLTILAELVQLMKQLPEEARARTFSYLVDRFPVSRKSVMKSTRDRPSMRVERAGQDQNTAPIAAEPQPNR